MSIAQQWNNNPSSRPNLSDEVRGTLAGLVSGGANVDYRGNPNIEVRSKSREFLEHIDSILGVFSRGIEAFRGETYRLRTRPHPDFGSLSFESPISLRYYYAYTGSIQTSPSLRVILPDDAPQIPQEYDTMNMISADGSSTRRKILPEENTKRFFNYIGNNPVPGCAKKWPTIEKEKPRFDEDSTPVHVDGERVASVKWENRDGEYVLLWYQRCFRVATENGAYSMSAELRGKIPDHIETVWVADRRNHTLLSFEIEAFYEDEARIPAGEYAVDTVQYAVDKERAMEEYNLPTELH